MVAMAEGALPSLFGAIKAASMRLDEPEGVSARGIARLCHTSQRQKAGPAIPAIAKG